MKYLLLISLLMAISLNLHSQKAGFCKSKMELHADSLYDYGYGLEKYDNPIDSAFCYNYFYNDNICHVSLDNLIAIDDNKLLSIVGDDNTIKEIRLKQNGTTLCNMAIPKRFQSYSAIQTGYRIFYDNKQYLLFYFGQNSPPSIWNTFLGVLVDLKETYIVTFPELLNTVSPLPLTDVDNDNVLDFIGYCPSSQNTISIYSLKNREFVRNDAYTCHLSSFDGYVWHIDTAYHNIISNYYKLKWKMENNDTHKENIGK